MIYPYYENPKMLERQVENWNRFGGELRQNVRIIVIDDGSPNNPALPILKECKAKVSLYRVKENIPWNQHGARNLGAKVVTDPNMWLYMSDMDLIMTPEVMFDLMSKELSEKNYYTFERRFLPDLNPEDNKYHCNTFMVKQKHYWAIGGYDEDYCGTYGGDGPFLRQLSVIAPRHHLNDITIYGVRETVIDDANTREWERTGPFKEEYRRRFDAKRRTGNEKSINPIRFGWEKLL